MQSIYLTQSFLNVHFHAPSSLFFWRVYYSSLWGFSDDVLEAKLTRWNTRCTNFFLTKIILRIKYYFLFYSLFELEIFYFLWQDCYIKKITWRIFVWADCSFVYFILFFSFKNERFNSGFSISSEILSINNSGLFCFYTFIL